MASGSKESYKPLKVWKNYGPLDDYFKSMGKVAILSREQEKELARRIIRGTKEYVVNFEGSLGITRESDKTIIEYDSVVSKQVLPFFKNILKQKRLGKILDKYKINKKGVSLSFIEGATMDFEINNHLNTSSKNLFMRYRTGDASEARQEMITSNLPLVVALAREKARRLGHGGELEDLVEAGNIGLIKAVEKYSPGKGVPFGKYAPNWIKQGMNSYLNEITEITNIRTAAYLTMKTIQKFEGKLTAQTNMIPKDEEILEYIKNLGEKEELPAHVKRIKLKDIQSMRPLYKISVLQLDDLMDSSNFYGEDSEIFYSSGGNPLDTVISEEEERELTFQLKGLDERSQIILFKKLGLGGLERMSSPKIGKELHLTGERINQINAKTLKGLRAELTGTGTYSHLYAEGEFDESKVILAG